MATGVRFLKTKTVVQLAALELFLDEFEPTQMIQALEELCELASTHAQYGHAGKPDAKTTEWAEMAITALVCLLEDDSRGDSPTVARVALDLDRGTIEFRSRRTARRREPSLTAATDPVQDRLASRPHARN